METQYSKDLPRNLDTIIRCDECGCERVHEVRKWSQHSNGYWNESKSFDCGRKFVFSPNFMQTGIDSVCRYVPAYNARRELLNKVRSEIFEFAEQRGLHADDLKDLKRHLEYWKIY